MSADVDAYVLQRVLSWPRLRRTMLVFFVPLMIAAGVPALATIIYNASDISISLENFRPATLEQKHAPTPVKAERPQQTPEITPTPVVDELAATWDRVRKSNEIDALYNFAKTYPESKYAGDAWRRMNALAEDGQLKFATLGDEYLGFIGDVLSHKEQAPAIVRRIADDHELDSKYPFGYAIFYSDGRKTVHSALNNPSQFVTFDPSTLEVAFQGAKFICIRSLSITANGHSIAQLTNNCFGGNGSVVRLINIEHSLEIDAEPLAQSPRGAAWVLGMRGL